MVGLLVGVEQLALAWPLVLVLMVVTGLIGWVTGDLIWRGVSAGSQKRVRALTERLTAEATRLLPPPGEEDG